MGRTDDWFKGRWKIYSAKLKKELSTKFKIGANGFSTVIEELKESISAKTLILHEQSNSNRIRHLITKRALYEGLEEKVKHQQTMPDAEESIKFWSNLWDNPIHHN